MKTTKLKNHVAPKARRLGQVLKTKFDVSLADFDNALNGDVAAAQKIGELARQGRLSSELAPKLAEAYQQIISGSEAYNKATADILVQAGKSAIAIDKAAMQATLANAKYAHQRSELAAEFVNSRNAENSRHNYQMNYTQIKGYVDACITSVDNRATLIEQSNRPELKQIAADESYDAKVLNHVLAAGENARPDLIQHRNYQPSKVKEILSEKFTAIKSALGF